MKKEGLWHEVQKTELERLCEQRANEGWRFMGSETLTETKFSKEAKFVQVQVQTEDDIKARCLKAAKEQDPTGTYEVDLVFYPNEKLKRLQASLTREEYESVLQQLRPEDMSYYVFVRKS